MHEDGKTHGEIAEHFGSERIQVKKCTADGEPAAAGFSGAWRKGVRTRVKYHVIDLHWNDNCAANHEEV